MMFLLDTNVLSELRRADRADARVAAWARSVDHLQFYLSAITILEIEVGTLLLARRDVQQGLVLRTWIDEHVLPAFEGRVLAVDTGVAQRCANLHVPDRRPERDALIAATALVHRLKLVTRNVADFEPMGVDLINPWE
ncbi:MAG: type II toxin-antitoxin system VapC family toxin [Burkholderiales bacterium]|nr:type II toxin-antitoxin system VapC family toxin [Burkholderiales bacterium]